MPTIRIDPTIPLNVHEVALDQPKRIRTLFESGEVVVLRGTRVAADFDFLSTVEPPQGDGSRRGKYVFWRVVNGVREGRASVWQMFEDEVFLGDKQRFRRFQDQIRSVDEQINEIVRRIFGMRPFLTETITWKFQRNRGENLHIDNLNGCDRVAQVRLFVNLDNKPRQWSVGRHWRHYAERLYDSANLQEAAHDPCRFNHQLTAAAFGVSTATCDEPRHLLELAPGEVWLANSALVAHQVRGGDVLALAHHEYPYRRYVNPSESLPAQLEALARRRSGSPLTFGQRMRSAVRHLAERGLG
jgi:hypothetical protein